MYSDNRLGEEKIRLANLNKNFGQVIAVQEVDLTLMDEDLLSLVGPSGCGKTTTLRLIAGFDEPDSGDIMVDDVSVLNLPPEKRNMGIVFQNYALFPHLTVAENIGYGLRFQKDIPTKDRIKEMLAMVDMKELADRMPDQLSAGQKQRVSLARSLAPAPGILLLDEPLSALDQKLQQKLKLEIKRIHNELELTTLWVTHDQAQALSIADKVAVMNRGRIEQLGPPREVYSRPVNEFTARFIGKGNLLRGEVKKIGDSRASIKINGSGIMEIKIDQLELKNGDLVLLLIRPEDFDLFPAEKDNSEGLTGEIIASEFLGDSTLLHILSGNKELLVKTDRYSEREFFVGQKWAVSPTATPHIVK